MSRDHGDATGVGTFDDAAVQRVLAHLNRCHQVENLRLARLAPLSESAIELHRAWIAGLDGTGVDFVAETLDGPAALRVEFEWPATTLAEAGEEMRRLYRAACRASI